MLFAFKIVATLQPQHHKGAAMNEWASKLTNKSALEIEEYHICSSLKLLI